jgi:hypothetical protein
MRPMIFVLVLALASCGGQDDPTTTTAGETGQVPPTDAIEVNITGVELSSSEVTIRGEAPTPCNDLGWSVSDEGDPIEVVVWAEPLDEGETCAQVIEPFEISVSFETPSRATPVVVNGDEVGRVGG